MSAPTRDAFLGGRLHLWQPGRGGFRSGSDAVLLAAACPARPGETVLDLGCGSGAAMLCVAARVPGVRVTGVERDPEAAALARRNGAEVAEGDMADLPPDLRARNFDHVICNPPYFAHGAGDPAADLAREAALREGAAGLGPWCDAACRRAGPRGTVTMIARADRLADLLAGLAPRLGDLRVRPVAARPGEAAGRVVVRGRKGARAPLRLLAPLSMHPEAGPGHAPLAEAILRDAAALPMDR